MRKTHVVIVAAVVTVLALLVAAWLVLDVNRYRSSMQNALAERLGRSVSLGPMRASLVPFGVTVENVAIAEDSAFPTGRPFAQSDTVVVRLRPLALLRGRVEVRSMSLRRPAIELVRRADGRWNVTSLGRHEGKETGEVVLDRLTIDDGQIAVTDSLRRAGARVLYRNVDVELLRFAARRPFGVDLSATLPNQGAQRLRIRGNAGPLPDDGITATPFDGVMEFDAVSLSGLQRFLQLRALEDSDAVISGSAALRSDGGQWSSKGSLRFEQARVRGVNLGYPIAADFDVSHDSGRGLLAIRAAALRLGETPLSIAGSVDLRPDTPVLDAHVAASDVSLAEAARLAAAFGLAFGADTRVQGRMTADIRARGAAKRPALDGTVRLRDVSISGTDIPRPVRTQAVDLVLTPDEIRSNDFSATTNGTALATRITVRQYTTPSPALDASVRTAGASVSDVLNIARAWGVRAARGVSGTGRVTLDVRAAGPLDNPALSGSGSLDAATLKMPALAEPLQVRDATLTFAAPSAAAGGASSGRLHAGTIANGSLVLDNVQTVIALDRGVVRLDPLTAALFGGTHRGSVVIDTRRTPSTFAVASTLQGVDANRLATAVADMRDVIHGSLTAVARVSFSAADAKGIARTLNGTVSLNVPNGRIAHMDVLHEVATIAQFVSGTPAAGGSTSVVALKGSFRVANGLANTSDLVATIEGGRIGAAGSVNLVSQALNMRMTAVLSQGFSRIAGGTQVGGFMGTVLANQKGELVVPMLVTGTLQQPRFAPDVERIAEMKMRNLVPSLRDPQALAGAILGAVGGQPAGTTGTKGAGDIIGTITGEQPPKDQQQKPAAKPQPKPPEQQIQEMLEQLLPGKKKPPAK